MKFSGLFSAVLTASLLFSASSPAFAAKEKGYQLTQYSDYWGPQTTYLTDKSIMIHSPKMQLTMVCRSPDWKVFCFNTKNKSYVTCGHKEWAEKFIGPSGMKVKRLNREQQMVQKYRHELDTGVPLKAGTYVTESLTVGGSKPLSGHRAVQFFMKGLDLESLYPPYLATTELWVVPSMKLDRNVVQTISDLSGIPAGIGVPIEIFRHMSKGKTLVQYRTEKIEPVTVDDSIFKLPTGYTQAADEMALLTEEKSGGKRGGLEEILGDDIDGLDALTADSVRMTGSKGIAASGSASRTPAGKATASGSARDKK